MKKKTRRSTTENAALNPQLNLKTRYEEIEDINEYFDSLPPEAQKWMNNYTENYVNASFKKDENKEIIPEKNLINVEFTKNLISNYLRKLKKRTKKDEKVISFIKKYLIREDKIPLKIIQELFFEKGKTKQQALIRQLRKEILDGIKDLRKKEIKVVMKLLEKEAYKINNSRNACIWTKEKAAGTLNYLEDLVDTEKSVLDEDRLIDIIDLRNELQELENTNGNSDDSSEDT